MIFVGYYFSSRVMFVLNQVDPFETRQQSHLAFSRSDKTKKLTKLVVTAIKNTSSLQEMRSN